MVKETELQKALRLLEEVRIQTYVRYAISEAAWESPGARKWIRETDKLLQDHGVVPALFRAEEKAV